jgi:hypothetical protein
VAARVLCGELPETREGCVRLRGRQIHEQDRLEMRQQALEVASSHLIHVDAGTPAATPDGTVREHAGQAGRLRHLLDEGKLRGRGAGQVALPFCNEVASIPARSTSAM